jgi:hypothetical protein
MIEEHMQ